LGIFRLGKSPKLTKKNTVRDHEVALLKGGALRSAYQWLEILEIDKSSSIHYFCA